MYFGSRISLADRKQLAGALKGLGIETREMTIDEYYITFEDPDSD